MTDHADASSAEPAMTHEGPADTGTTSVAERLLVASSRFARTALDAYVAETWDVFYLHLSTAVEQLLKSVLASADPTLIAAKGADFDTYLHLTGHREYAKTPESAVRTVTVTEAIRRVSQVHHPFRQATPRVTFLLDMRNGVVHAGHTVRAEHQAVLGEVATFVDQFLGQDRIERPEYWGVHADLVAEHAQRRMNTLEGAFRRKVRAAREAHERLFATLSDDEQAAFLESREPQELADDYDAARADCPSCGHLGLVTGDPEPDWEADWDTEGGEAYVSGAYVSSVRLFARAFHCQVCGLTLDTDALSFTGFATVDLTEADADLEAATEYFTRQLAEEDWDWP